MTTPHRTDLEARVERLEELAMFAERESSEARASIADVLGKLASINRRLAAIEERVTRLPLGSPPPPVIDEGDGAAPPSEG